MTNHRESHCWCDCWILKNHKRKESRGRKGGETRNDEAQQGRRKKQLERCTIPAGKAELLLVANSHFIVLAVCFLIFFSAHLERNPAHLLVLILLLSGLVCREVILK